MRACGADVYAAAETDEFGLGQSRHRIDGFGHRAGLRAVRYDDGDVVAASICLWLPPLGPELATERYSAREAKISKGANSAIEAIPATVTRRLSRR